MDLLDVIFTKKGVQFIVESLRLSVREKTYHQRLGFDPTATDIKLLHIILHAFQQQQPPPLPLINSSDDLESLLRAGVVTDNGLEPQGTFFLRQHRGLPPQQVCWVLLCVSTSRVLCAVCFQTVGRCVPRSL